MSRHILNLFELVTTKTKTVSKKMTISPINKGHILKQFSVSRILQLLNNFEIIDKILKQKLYIYIYIYIYIYMNKMEFLAILIF